MEFCPKCKSILAPKKENGETLLVCSCGFKKAVEKKEMREKGKKDTKIDIVHDETNPLAVYPHKCKKCGYGKAQLISKGIWYSDEDEVIEYVCGKCGAHEREEGIKVT